MKDALNPQQLDIMRAAADEVFAEILSYEGAQGRAYHSESGRLPHRYSYGTSSSSREMLHHPAWAMLTVRAGSTHTQLYFYLSRGWLIWPKSVSDAHHCCGRVQELETCCPIIDKIYNSPGSDSEWAISGAGGDMALPGAVECQSLHRDSAPPDLGLDIGGKSFKRRSSHARTMDMKNYIEVLLKDLRDSDEHTAGSEMSLYTMRALSETMPPSGTINFLLTDSTWENGPIRTILGSHCNVQQPPKTDEEPEWMRLSTLVGATGNTSARPLAARLSILICGLTGHSVACAVQLAAQFFEITASGTLARLISPMKCEQCLILSGQRRGRPVQESERSCHTTSGSSCRTEANTTTALFMLIQGCGRAAPE